MGFGTFFYTGGRYNPSTDSWAATSTSNVPDARAHHTAVWTGSEMIVWGGLGDAGYLDTGGRYTPDTDSWTATNTANAPVGRTVHGAIWTGKEMIIWGGSYIFIDTHYLNTGGRYNPNTDSWTATSITDAPEARTTHTAVWTGNEMIVWGGQAGLIGHYFNTGGRYDPSTDSWIATSTNNVPDGRYRHTAVLTPNEMIVWGGNTLVLIRTLAGDTACNPVRQVRPQLQQQVRRQQPRQHQRPRQPHALGDVRLRRGRAQLRRLGPLLSTGPDLSPPAGRVQTFTTKNQQRGHVLAVQDSPRQSY
jgi:N-acetylneuraminic acid mutarotase